MDKKELLSLNIVFMPPKEVFDFSISQFNEIAKNNAVSFKLDGVNNFPHITIYQLNIPSENLEKLYKALEDITGGTLLEDLEFTEYEMHEGYIGVSFLPSESIRRTQRQVIEVVNKLREGRNVVEPDSAAASHFSDKQREVIKEFGFDNLLEFYNPHITITRMADVQKAEEIIKTLKWPFKEFKASSIGVYERGEYGTCNKLLKEFRLGAVG